jgi:enoyl-CoA hydratase
VTLVLGRSENPAFLPYAHALAEPDELIAAALALAAEILEGAPLSVRAARDMVMLSTEMGRTAALRAARHASETAYRSEDGQEGPRAFAEKRRPRWKGL